MSILCPIDKKMATEDTCICPNLHQSGQFRPRRSYRRHVGPPVKREDNGLLLLPLWSVWRGRGRRQSLWSPLFSDTMWCHSVLTKNCNANKRFIWGLFLEISIWETQIWADIQLCCEVERKRQIYKDRRRGILKGFTQTALKEPWSMRASRLRPCYTWLLLDKNLFFHRDFSDAEPVAGIVSGCRCLVLKVQIYAQGGELA